MTTAEVYALCDACHQARAIVTAVKDDLELKFCGHHSTAHGPALLADGWVPAEIPEEVTV